MSDTITGTQLLMVAAPILSTILIAIATGAIRREMSRVESALNRLEDSIAKIIRWKEKHVVSQAEALRTIHKKMRALDKRIKNLEDDGV